MPILVHLIKKEIFFLFTFRSLNQVLTEYMFRYITEVACKLIIVKFCIQIFFSLFEKVVKYRVEIDAIYNAGDKPKVLFVI